MPQSTMTYVLNHIIQNIPPQILDLCFQPRQFQTTLEARIMAEIIEGPVLLDTNLVAGKRRDIFIQEQWKMWLPSVESAELIGSGVQGSYYKIPPWAREGRNISSVVGVVPSMVSSLPGSSINYNGTGSFGNTASGMLSEMINTRTFGQYPLVPRVTLEGTNIVCFYPEDFVEGVAVSVFLEYDAEFLNMNQSAIVAMRHFCLCATQRYIATKLRVSVDETEIVGGMEIGVVKDIINDYLQKAENYEALLIKVKGASSFDSRSLSNIIRAAL